MPLFVLLYNIKVKDNILLKNDILWYDINENGYIQGELKYKSAVYIFMKTCEKKSFYVGASLQLRNRLSNHRSRINNWNKDYYNNNGSLLFYNSVLKYGWNNFKFGILEYVNLSDNKDINKSVLLQREQYYLNVINPSLNVCKIAGSSLGVKHGISFSVNLSKARRGKKIKTKKLKTIKVRVITSDTRLKLSSRSIGIKVKIFDNLNNLVNEFPTMTSAAKYLGVSIRTIRRILNTGISYDDYIYMFETIPEYTLTVFNKESNIIREYSSVRAISKDLGISTPSISKHINRNELLKGIYLITKKKN